MWSGGSVSLAFHLPHGAFFCPPVFWTTFDPLFYRAFKPLSPRAARNWTYDGGAFEPVDLSALILRKISQQIEQETGDREFRAVVTHPREFSAVQREATKKAVEYADIDLIDTLFEPVAASYAYFEPGAERDPGHYLVFDLGGGTLDIAVLNVPERGQIHVIGGSGADIGGRNWDDQMLQEILGSLKRDQFPDVGNLIHELSGETLHELRQTAVDWKEKANMRKEFQRQIQQVRFQDGEVVSATIGGFEVERWERRCERLVERCSETIDRTLEETGLGNDDLVRVLPVGGSTKLEMIQEMLEERFGDQLVSLRSKRYDPQLAVAKGAGRFASYRATSQEVEKGNEEISGEQLALFKEAQEAQMVTDLPHEICIKAQTPDGEIRFSSLIEKGTELPYQIQKTYTVPEGMTEIAVPIYECEEGPYQPGIPEVATIEFPESLDPQPGDRVTFIIEARQSAQLEVIARHEGTGETQSIELQTARKEQHRSASRSAERADRKRFLQEIEVH